MMTYFDPTVDWSKILLDEPLPDLIVTRSKALKDPSVPWRESAVNWGCDWVQYSAAISNDWFLSFTFFDSLAATQEDRDQFYHYQERNSAESLIVQKYQSVTPASGIQRLVTCKSSAQR